jgi:hypothetical protein
MNWECSKLIDILIVLWEWQNQLVYWEESKLLLNIGMVPMEEEWTFTPSRSISSQTWEWKMSRKRNSNSSSQVIHSLFYVCDSSAAVAASRQASSEYFEPGEQNYWLALRHRPYGFFATRCLSTPAAGPTKFNGCSSTLLTRSINTSWL